MDIQKKAQEILNKLQNLEQECKHIRAKVAYNKYLTNKANAEYKWILKDLNNRQNELKEELRLNRLNYRQLVDARIRLLERGEL